MAMNRAWVALTPLGIASLLICCGEPETAPDAAAGTAGTGGTMGYLLAGDSALCPRAASPEQACSDPELACTYAGGQFGLSTILDPVTCFCTDNAFVCVESDADGRTECPILAEPQGAACAQDQVCYYGQGIRVAECRCQG